ncbi:MAG TPA: ABC transporter ATP-binding protein [Thermoplasmata archaeon]|nr:ABC transporter ATP-binding protein [Thermoplasmata archaeon]
MNQSGGQAPILAVQDVTKSFGGIRAVDECSLEVQPGRITGLIGPNGAGKSTLFNVIAGLYAPDAGQVYFEGDRVDGLPPYRIVRRGLMKTFQIPRELRNMTVLENLMVASPPITGERLTDLMLHPFDVRKSEAEAIERAEGVLQTVGLRNLRDEYAKNLSGGQKKLIELARALMARPKLVLLDEPIAGVNPTLAQRILSVIESLRDAGVTFFLIEHDMDVVMKRCQWIIVMHQGRRLVEGLPDEIKANPKVIDSYLGG